MNADYYPCPKCGGVARDLECPACDGTGTMGNGKLCSDCHGNGTLDGICACVTCGYLFYETSPSDPSPAGVRVGDQVTRFTPHYRLPGLIAMVLAIGGGWGVMLYRLLYGVYGIADGIVVLGAGVVAWGGCLGLWQVAKRIVFRKDDILIEHPCHRMIRLRYGDIRDIGRDAIITTQGVFFLGIIANVDALIDTLCDKIHEGKIVPHQLAGKLRVTPWVCLPRISWRLRGRTRCPPSTHHYGIWINVRSDRSGKPARSGKPVRRWQRLQAYVDQGRIRRVERIVTGIAYHEWVRTVSAEDILFYLSAKTQLWTCRMVLINAICRYPFPRKKQVTAVCRIFHELLLRFEAYQQTDVLCAIVGFFEAAGFTPALYELTWWRNYFLQTGVQPDAGIILVLDHAITHLLALGRRRISQV